MSERAITTGKSDGSLGPFRHATLAHAEAWLARQQKVDPEGVARGDYFIDVREPVHYWRHGEPTTEGHTARRITVVIPFDAEGDDESACDYVHDALLRAEVNVLAVEVEIGPAMAA